MIWVTKKDKLSQYQANDRKCLNKLNYYLDMCVYIYIYIYREREREREVCVYDSDKRDKTVRGFIKFEKKVGYSRQRIRQTHTSTVAHIM